MENENRAPIDEVVYLILGRLSCVKFGTKDLEYMLEMLLVYFREST
jgi:hypothetical protein